MAAEFGSEHLSPLEEAIVDGWVEQTMHAGGDVHWAWPVLRSLIENAPERAWPLILAIVHRAPDHGLDLIGAGPIEELLSSHGGRIIATVEAQAARDTRFRRALVGMRQLFMSDEVYERVRAAAGPAEGIAAGADDEDESPFVTRRVELRPQGRPPGGTENPAEELVAVERLRAAIADVPTSVQIPFTGPVYMDIVLELRPGTAPANPPAVIDAIIRTLTGRDGALAAVALVRHVEYRAMAAHEDGYMVNVAQMSTDQAAAFDDPRDLEEMLAEDRLEGL